MAAPADIPLDKAYLTAIWLETMFFGASFSFIYASWQLLKALLPSITG